jgi:hypothetical protein
MSEPHGTAFKVDLDHFAQGGKMYVLAGVIDENADLSFFESLSGHARLHMKAVRRINSYGVRSWIEAIRTVPPDVVLE